MVSRDESTFCQQLPAARECGGIAAYAQAFLDGNERVAGELKRRQPDRGARGAASKASWRRAQAAHALVPTT